MLGVFLAALAPLYLHLELVVTDNKEQLQLMTNPMTDCMTDQMTNPMTSTMTDLMTDPMTDAIMGPLTDSMSEFMTNTMPGPITDTMTSLNCDVRTVSCFMRISFFEELDLQMLSQVEQKGALGGQVDDIFVTAWKVS